MAAKPALHIFPPVEEVHKRRESLDELIRRSMDMRPTGPWPAKSEVHGVQPKYTNPKLKPTGGRSPTNVESVVIKIDAGEPAPVAAPTQDRPIARTMQRPNPNPLQVPEPSVVRQRSSSTSPSRARPQRRPSVSNSSRRRGPSPAPATIREGVVENLTSDVPVQGVSPISPEENAATQKNIRFQEGAPSTQMQRNIPSRTSSRQAGVSPITPDSSEGSTPVSALEQKMSSRASNRNKGSPVSPPKRHVSSRASNRRHVVVGSPIGSRVVSPAPSEQTLTDSPTLVRSNSAATWKKQSPVSPGLPMRSMFPTYDHKVSLQRQTYRPSNIIPPSAIVAAEKSSKPAYSPTYEKEMPPKPIPDLSTPTELSSLWEVANGNVNPPNPKTFAMKMYRPESGAKKQKIVFGPEETKPFYSLSQSHPTSIEEDPLHELLVFRHSPSNEDILPICHHMLNPPPPPALSKANRGSVSSDVREPAVCITNITPIIATLHSLDCAAKTKEAHTLALVDPRATSPAAAKLAERAVADAIAREACTLAWTQTDPKNGKYELHHPSLGVFTIAVEGDVKAAFERPNNARGRTSIYMTNPFASLTPNSSNSPSSFYSGDAASLASSSKRESVREQAVLARLDLQDDILQIDAQQIQQLGNIYLVDMCVAALLSVAVAETQRPDDPGLVFAAPPPSPFALGTTRSAKKKAAKAAAKYVESEEKAKAKEASRKAKGKKRRTLTNGETMDLSMAGIQHLADEDDLPRLTKGILSVLGLSFKTAVWLMSVGVKIMAHMVVGMSRVVAKDGL